MYSSLTSLGLSDEQLRIFGIFHPHNLKKIAFALENNLRFVHYTTADTAIKIIRKGSVDAESNKHERLHGNSTWP